MKQYDNIMVPADEKETSPHFIAGGMWQSKSNVIVLSLEEAEELFRAGGRWQMSVYSNKKDEPNFSNYLTSKGITLP